MRPLSEKGSEKLDNANCTTTQFDLQKTSKTDNTGQMIKENEWQISCKGAVLFFGGSGYASKFFF